MSDTVTTRLGDTVSFDRRGSGPALIFVAGAGPSRQIDPVTTATAESAQRLTTIVYDRVGRGESPAEGAITLDRELAAIAALIDAAGGSAILCGHSSGCSISLAAAAAGLPVSGLVLFEPPFGPEHGGAAEWTAEVGGHLRAGELELAVLEYMRDMPPEFLDGARRSPIWPVLVGGARALQADGESLVWVETAPLDELLADIRVPVSVLYAEQTLPVFTEAAARIVEAISGASEGHVPGADHSWEVAPMASELERFALETVHAPAAATA